MSNSQAIAAELMRWFGIKGAIVFREAAEELERLERELKVMTDSRDGWANCWEQCDKERIARTEYAKTCLEALKETHDFLCWGVSSKARVLAQVDAAIAKGIENAPSGIPLPEAEKGLETMISFWSMRPAPGTPSGIAWVQGCKQGFEWGRKYPNGDGWKPAPPDKTREK